MRLVTYGHVGDGNLHYNLAAPAGDEGATPGRRPHPHPNGVRRRRDRRGSISAEHGLGVLKRAAASSYMSEVEVDLMRAVKGAVDPDGLMNPGKVVACSSEPPTA